MNYSEIETALELDSDVLQDEKYLEQQSIIERHYTKAAELEMKGYQDRAEKHHKIAYEAALDLREMVIQELGRGPTWGRVSRRLEEERE